ncbi:MAG TPA: hypothetical protein PKO22_05505 [Treponemataceae bacterium]|nr:hypothetical protein [Treponemataceae bacterium]
MKVRTVLKISLAAFLSLIVLLAGFSLFGVGVPEALARAAGNVPVLRNFVARDYDTGTFASTARPEYSLKVARYDVEFLASFRGPAGRYVAIYPFAVEASVDLSRASRDARTKTVRLPFPAFESRLDATRAKSLVLMAGFVPDYDTVLAPVLEAYSRRSVDCALCDSEFVTAAFAAAESRVAGLFPGTRVQWTGVKPGTVRHASEKLPVSFVYEDASAGADSAPVFPFSFEEPPTFRDDLLVRGGPFAGERGTLMRFGLSGHDGRDITSFSRAAVAANSAERVVFQYHDPIRPRDATFFSFADDGYRTAFAYLSGARNVYYLESLAGADVNDEYRLRHDAPGVLYLASGLEPASAAPSRAADHQAFLESHERALAELRAGRFGRTLGNEIVEMERLTKKPGDEDSNLSVFRKLYAMQMGVYSPLKDTGYVGTVALLEALAASDYGRFAGSLRAESEAGVRTDAAARANLEAIFWTMRKEIGIPDSEADAYRRDLVASGETLSASLVASLSERDRVELLRNFFVRRLGSSDIRAEIVSRGAGEDLCLFWGAGALAWSRRHMPKDLIDRLERHGLTGSNRLILVFADPPESEGLFVALHALAFDGTSVTACADFTAWFRFAGDLKPVPYSGIECADGAFRLDGHMFKKTGELARAMATLRAAFAAEDWNRDELTRLVKGDLVKRLGDSLERPVLLRY